MPRTFTVEKGHVVTISCCTYAQNIHYGKWLLSDHFVLYRVIVDVVASGQVWVPVHELEAYHGASSSRRLSLSAHLHWTQRPKIHTRP